MVSYVVFAVAYVNCYAQGFIASIATNNMYSGCNAN